ncbi:MAG: hypothetical protein APF76_05835 [Desulfitibacter sp. BRH_c19]|nr:MAG: hypothetical protein APF76_05835 [Desulfitibacter sp. BRH_c19]
MKKVLIVIIAAIFLVVSGCGAPESQLDLDKANIEDLNRGSSKQEGTNSNDNKEGQDQPKPYLEKIEHFFNAKEAQLGDIVGDMTITSIIHLDSDPANFQALINLSGATTISGQYVHYDNHETLGNIVVFVVNEDSLAVLPQLEQDERYIWFSFSNQDEAKEAFGKPGSKGTATIVIDDYQINFAESYDLGNMAKLIEVVEKK